MDFPASSRKCKRRKNHLMKELLESVPSSQLIPWNRPHDFLFLKREQNPKSLIFHIRRIFPLTVRILIALFKMFYVLERVGGEKKNSDEFYYCRLFHSSFCQEFFFSSSFSIEMGSFDPLGKQFDLGKYLRRTATWISPGEEGSARPKKS